MSTAIDNRVVQMEFDNQRFEKNVATSISTLDKLKAALKLDGATKGLDAVEKSVRGFDLSSLSSAVDTISSKFSAMGIIGVTALQNITNKAIDAGIHLVKSMSLDQITSGWDKYADKTSSVQTIMAATAETWREDANSLAILNNLMAEGMAEDRAKQYASVWQQYNDGAIKAKAAAKSLEMTQDEFLASVEKTKDAMSGFDGSQMDYVNEQMSKLNWFTDETSYNFVDMVGNIGKFTANQIPLSQAATAMQGIANWAAVSGQNAGAASRAMYNLSQAIGVGSVKLMDWRSIENANMATASFKNKVLESAEAMGVLTKGLDGVYRTSEGTEVSIQNFSQTLSEGWFNKDVLIDVLDEYGSFTNELYEFSQATDLTATEILELIEAQEKGTLSTADIKKAAEEAGISAEEFEKSLKSLGSAENKFGRDAFRAAQEAKTFAEAIDATKDAASTAWMNIFENLFGDYEKARHLWTGFANFLYDALVAPLEKVQDLTETLGRLDAVERIAKGFKDLFGFIFNGKENSHGILESIKTGFQRVIPPLEITTEMLAKAIDKFRHFAATLKLSGEQASILRQAGQGLASALLFAWNSLKNFWDATSGLRSSLGKLASSIGNLVLRIFASGKDMDTSGIKFEAFRKICDSVANIIDKLSDALNGVKIEGISSDFSIFGAVIDGIKSGLQWIGEKASGILEGIMNAFQNLKDFISSADWGTAFKVGFGAIFAGFLAFKGMEIKDLLSPLMSIKEAFIEIQDLVWSKNLSNLTAALKNIAIGIGILAVALLVLSYVDYEKAFAGIMLIASILTVAYLAMQNMDKSLSVGKIAKLAGLGVALIALSAALLVFAVALAALAGALALFALVAKMDTVAQGLGYLTITLFVVIAAMEVLSKMSPKVIVAAVAFGIMAASLLFLAAALAAFALIAKMDTIAEGLLYLAATLAIAVVALAALSTIGPKVLIGAVALAVLSVSLLVLAAAVAAFAAAAKMDTIAEGLIYLAATLAVAIAGLMVLASAGPMIAVAALSLVIVSAALLVLAGALAAFAAVAGSESGWAGLATLIVLLASLTVVLVVLGGTGPMVLAGAAALLVAAAACLVLAVAVGVVGLALPLLAIGLASLGQAIGTALTAIGQGAQDFLVSLSDALVAVGDALAEIITTIAGSLGEAVSLLGEGIAEAIADIIASVGEGIGRGITAISDAIGTFGNNLTNAGLGITNFGDGVRSLKGIDWLGTAAGIADLAKSLKKLKPDDLASDMKPASEAIVTMCTEMITALENTMTSFEGAGQRIVNSFVSGINNAMGSISGAGTQIINSIVSAIMIAGEMSVTSQRAVSLGKLFGNGFVKGINEKLNKIRESGISVIDSLIGGAMSKNGEAEVAGGSLVQTITDAFSQAFQLLNGEGEGGGLQEAGAGMVASLIAGITASTEQVDTSGQALGLALVTGFSNKQTDFETAATKMSTDAAGKINETQSSWSDAGEYLGQGLIAGINNMEGPVMEAASALAEKAAEAIRAALDINSPSRVTTRFGEYFGMGFINGISSQIGGAESVSSAMVNATIGALDQARSLISRILEDDFTPVITPVLDTSMIQGSLNGMSNLSVAAGIRNARDIGHVASAAEIQNGTPMPTTAVLSDSAIRALAARQTTPNKTVIEFTGDLAQLARVLHPVIVDQYNYHGDKLIN